MDVPPELLRAARSALGLSQFDVAELSGISTRTIYRMEQNDDKVRLETLRQVQAALEKKGVSFLPGTDGNGPGLRISRTSVVRKDLRF